MTEAIKWVSAIPHRVKRMRKLEYQIVNQREVAVGR
jgi:hypothetical protein